MEPRRLCIVLALLVFFVSLEISTILAQSNGNGNGNGNSNAGGNNGNGNGNENAGGNNGNGNGNGNGGGNNGNGNGNGNGGGNNGNGNGNGNGGSNSGNGNGNGNGNGGGNNGNGNGNGNGNDGGKSGNGKGGGNDDADASAKARKREEEAATTNYEVLSPLPKTGQERGFCQAQGDCHYRTLICPSECPQRKPKKNKKQKACFLDCSSKCEATCKWRKPKCNGYGSLCYDPRFVGGDGVMFYFHGSKGSNFAIVSDDNLHINAHLIGSRPKERTRDFTWVQALSIMFEAHTLVLAARKVQHWNDNVDALIVKWDGASVDVPSDGEAEWRVNAGGREVVVERTDDVNTVMVRVSGLVELGLRVSPIGEKESRAHSYQLPLNDAFAHLEMQFKFFDLSDEVEGILGKTYRPGYVSPVKRGVPMPMMGGEDRQKCQYKALFKKIYQNRVVLGVLSKCDKMQFGDALGLSTDRSQSQRIMEMRSRLSACDSSTESWSDTTQTQRIMEMRSRTAALKIFSALSISL